MNLKKLLKYPMQTTIVYLVFTIFLFVFGPIKWNIPSYFKLISFLCVYILSFYCGYVLQLNKKLSKKHLYDIERFDPDSTKFGFLATTDFRSVKLIFLASCLFSIVKCIVFMLHLYGTIDFSLLLKFDLGESYFERLDSNVLGRWYISLFDLLNVFDMFWYILGIIYYKKLKTKYKCLYFICIAFNVLFNIAGGTMISWALFVLKLIPFVFLEIYNLRFSNNKMNKKKSKKILIMILVIALLFVALFNFAQISRQEYKGDSGEIAYDEIEHLEKFIIEDRELMFLDDIISSVDFYITNGYCGMAYALELPPSLTFGLGFSRDFAKRVNAVFGIDVSDTIYPQRVEDEFGWLNGRYWPSAFTWFASDLSFYGIPIFMFLFGMFLCNVWFSALYEKSVVAVILFSWLWIGIVFLPANNQLFQSFDKFMATMGLLVLYLFRKTIPRPIF